MAKKAYIGVGGIARKVKKGYVGVGGLAKKIKKAYIGIGGVARPCWAGGVARYGTLANLSEAKRYLAAASVANYAIFAGGSTTDNTSTAIDVYDTRLTKVSTSSVLGARRSGQAAGTIGNHALFSGGTTDRNVSGSSTGVQSVYAVNGDTLVRTTITDLSSKKHSHKAARTTNHLLFGGGLTSTYSYQTSVNAFNSDLTKSNLDALQLWTTGYPAGSVGEYAVFNGDVASDSSSGNVTNVYDSALTRTKLLPALTGTNSGGSATICDGKYVLFAVGDVIKVLDDHLTALPTLNMSVKRFYGEATSVGEYAVIAGGYDPSGASTSSQAMYYTNVDVVDGSLTLTTLAENESLSVGRGDFAATSVGNYAIFAGGRSDRAGKFYATVDAYLVD